MTHGTRNVNAMMWTVGIATMGCCDAPSVGGHNLPATNCCECQGFQIPDGAPVDGNASVHYWAHYGNWTDPAGAICAAFWPVLPRAILQMPPWPLAGQAHNS